MVLSERWTMKISNRLLDIAWGFSCVRYKFVSKCNIKCYMLLICILRNDRYFLLFKLSTVVLRLTLPTQRLHHGHLHMDLHSTLVM